MSDWWSGFSLGVGERKRKIIVHLNRSRSFWMSNLFACTAENTRLLATVWSLSEQEQQHEIQPMKNRILLQEVEREVVSSTRTMSAVAPDEETTPENANSRLKSSCSFFLCCGQEDWLKKGEFIVWNIYKTEKVTRSMLLIFHSIITNTSEKEQVKSSSILLHPRW